MKKWGVDAVEVLHPSHGPDLRERIGESAARTGMLYTGGTDWHGRSMQYEGGALGDIAVPADWFERLESLHDRRLTDRDG